MRRLLKITVALATLTITCACSTTHFADVAETPNPASPPGYRVACRSVPTILNGFSTNCLPYPEPVIVHEPIVIRTKG